jgi:NitT/TauT family transport system substrate-binding protein
MVNSFKAKIVPVGLVLCLLILVQPANGLAEQTDLTKVSLVPQWIPQAQFAGYMVALEKGFYRDVGLDLTLLEGGPGKPSFELMVSGQATFCTGWLSNAIEMRASGLRIVELAQITQKSALLLVARKSSGIMVPKDLHGKKVGLWTGHFLLEPMVFFRKYGINVEIIPNYSSVALLLKGGVDAISGMWYNEYNTIINSGFNKDELTVFILSDFGPSFPEDGLFTLEKTYESDPDMCQRFVEASIKGWIYAFDNPEEALDLVMKHTEAAHTGTNRNHQKWMLARMKDLVMPKGDEAGVGKLKEEDYVWVGQLLKQYGFVHEVPELKDFYRGRQ